MRLLIDENLGRRLVRLLQKLGHDVVRVPLGIKNGAVMRLAAQGARVLVTRDADFTDAARFPPSRSHDISLAGRLFVVGETGYIEFK